MNRRHQEPGAHNATNPPSVAESPRPTNMRRIAMASSIGTVIEYYDFMIFAAAAALVFPKVFFPALGTAAGTVASFATLGVAFVARPVGSILFGHFGDRFGRKWTLLSTLFLMGIATVLVGVMPTADQIGVTAPILVVVLRILQGIAVGGEWTGATLMATESAPKENRGFWSVFGSLGSAIGSALASGTFLLAGLTMNSEEFVSYGWRIPFIASAVMLAIGLYIRGKVEETPVFSAEVARSGTAKAPFVEAVKRQPREIFFASGLLVMVFAFSYLTVGYMVNYGTTTLGLSKVTILAITIVASFVVGLGLLLGAAVSDRVGRRAIMIGANVVAVPWALALFPVLDGATPARYAIGACVTAFIAGVALGPVGAFMSELFHTRYRYTAAGFSYNVGGVLGGAVPSVVGAAITATYGGFVFGIFLAILCLISLVCALALRETRELEIDRLAAMPVAEAAATD